MSDPVGNPVGKAAKNTFPITATACCLNTLSDIAAQINNSWKKRWEMESPGLCFRGGDSDGYDLNPSLLREPYPEGLEDLAKLENSLWVEFRLRSQPLLGRQVSSGWEAMLIMQQFGLPTRLLDWSKSLAIAAYFSVRDINSDENGVVWLMASRYLMEQRGAIGVWRTAVGDPTIASMSLRDGDTGLLVEFNEQIPVTLDPDRFVQRMTAQRGIYTLHTFKRHALESLAETDRKKFGDACYLHKIVIPRSAKAGLRSELLVIAGVSEETLFPDIEGFARDFVWEQYRLRRGEIGPKNKKQ